MGVEFVGWSAVSGFSVFGGVLLMSGEWGWSVLGGVLLVGLVCLVECYWWGVEYVGFIIIGTW